MKTQLKNSFFQVFGATAIWLTFIMTTFFAKGQSVSIGYLWNIVAVSLISALLFGVLYIALWNHFTLSPIWNTIIGSVANTVGGYVALLLLAKAVFFIMLPWSPAVLALSLILHGIAFYFYARHKNKKDAADLNEMLNAQ